MDLFGKIDIGGMMKMTMVSGDGIDGSRRRSRKRREAYVRIQNRSSHPRIRVSIPRVLNARASSSSSSLGVLLSGEIRADRSLPHDDGDGDDDGRGGGVEVGPFPNGRRYARILLGRDDDGNDNNDDDDDDDGGRACLVVFEARVVTGGGGGGGGGAATLKFIANDDGWKCEDDDRRGSSSASSPIVLVADVIEMRGKGGDGNDDDDDDKDGIAAFWKVELRAYDNIDASRWMEVLGKRIEDVPFNRLGLPGTHDSGTYAYDRDMGASPDSDLTKTIDRFCPGMLGDAILGNVFARLCQCQSKNVHDQLMSGVRYLDLRVARHAESGKYYTCHGVYCADMSNVMHEVDAFLSDHPREIVVLDFNHLYDMDGHHPELLRMIFDALGDKAASPKGIGCNSRVSDFWTRGKQAMVIYHASSDVWKGLPCANRTYHNGYIHSPWPESNDVDDLRAKLSGYVRARCDDEARAGQLFVLQGILTPDVELIKSGLMRGDGISIRAYANDTNARLVDWCEEEWMAGGRVAVGDDDAGEKGGGGRHGMLNIVIVDFIEGTSIIPAIINYNGRR